MQAGLALRPRPTSQPLEPPGGEPPGPDGDVPELGALVIASAVIGAVCEAATLIAALDASAAGGVGRAADPPKRGDKHSGGYPGVAEAAVPRKEGRRAKPAKNKAADKPSGGNPGVAEASAHPKGGRRAKPAAAEKCSGGYPGVAEAAAPPKEGRRAKPATDDDWRRLVAESWKEVRDQEGKRKGEQKEEPGAESGAAKAAARQTSSRGQGFLGGLLGRGGKAKASSGAEEGADASKGATEGAELALGASSRLKMPRTFLEMGRFNAQMIGANESWINIVLKSFDMLVVSVCNSDDPRLRKEIQVIVLRMHKTASGAIELKQFRTVMLVSLRSMLLKTWSMELERAWAQMWDACEACLEPNLQLPARYEKPIERFVSALSASDLRAVGLATFKLLFERNPQSEMYFKQSNERLCFIARRAIELSLEILREPQKTVDDITALGLKHIMFGIATEYFEPFVVCCMEAVETKCKDPVALEGLDWSMRIVASIMVHTIEDGSNPLLQAVLKNDVKQLRRELGKLPKGQRNGAAVGAL